MVAMMVRHHTIMRSKSAGRFPSVIHYSLWWTVATILVLVDSIMIVKVQAIHSYKSKFQVVAPSFLSKGGEQGYDHQDAIYGVFPFTGKSVEQPIYYYADDELLCCPSYNPSCVSNDNNEESWWPQPPRSKQQQSFILMIDRGLCELEVKVGNAQRQFGPSAIVISDSTCRCDRPDCPPTPGRRCQDEDVISGSSLYHYPVTVPSLMIFKEDADEIKTALKKNPQEPVRAKLFFEMTIPNVTVEYDLWIDSFDMEFSEQFASVATAIGRNDQVVYKPHFFFYDGEMSGCRSDSEDLSCPNVCFNRGRYCYGMARSTGRTTNVVMREALRRSCIWQTYGTDGIGTKWWDYAVAFRHSCAGKENDARFDYEIFKDPHCVSAAMAMAGIDEQIIQDCMMESGELSEHSDTTNTLLEKELEEQRAAPYGIGAFPTLVVNGFDASVGESISKALQAICLGFTPGSEPEICQRCVTTSQYCHEDVLDCIASNGVCRRRSSNVLVGFAAVGFFCLAGGWWWFRRHYRRGSWMQGGPLRNGESVAEFVLLTLQKNDSQFRQDDNELAL